jgi:hypothetical protein
MNRQSVSEALLYHSSTGEAFKVEHKCPKQNGVDSHPVESIKNA